MAYLGLSPDIPEYFIDFMETPCGAYCNQGADMRYIPRPEGCTCPGESMPPENKELPIIRNEVRMTPQQIERAVKQETGGALVLASLAALFLLG